ncbi:MAG: fumarylacetoacetase [Planctomycetota bacterium]
MIDFTHDASRTSWADDGSAEGFGIQNLPYCVFKADGDPEARIGCGIGNQVLDVGQLARSGCLVELENSITDVQTLSAMRSLVLNDLMALPATERVAIRKALSEVLDSKTELVQNDDELRRSMMYSLEDVELQMPVRVGDFTDFYASLDHATNVGSMFRPDNPLMPNYKWVPIAYHGRSSSVVLSGSPVRRPSGQIGGSDSRPPEFLPSRRLDYELELGIWTAVGNELGQPVDVRFAREELFFGVSLLNDWSARDIQRWEYQPLGPFLGKNFSTSIAPWIVTRESLVPFRCPSFERVDGPKPLEYLYDKTDEESGGLKIRMEVYLQTAKMQASGIAPERISHSDTSRLFWTVAQMLTHHASNGCNLRPGDLFGSGTVSGPRRENRGCLLELTWAGDSENVQPGSARTPLSLSNGERREFLDDGDEVILRGVCEAEGFAKISLGECRGKILPA